MQCVHPECEKCPFEVCETEQDPNDGQEGGLHNRPAGDEYPYEEFMLGDSTEYVDNTAMCQEGLPLPDNASYLPTYMSLWGEDPNGLDEPDDPDRFCRDLWWLGGGKPLPPHPSIFAFYEGKELITEANQLGPGLKVTRYYGCYDPARGGERLVILSVPFDTDNGPFMKVREFTENGGSYELEISLTGAGIMPDGQTPKHMNRLVLGWPTE